MRALDQARRVIRWCRDVATRSDAATGTTRTCLSPAMRRVHTDLAGWMSGAGMQVRVDAIGNLRGVFPAASFDDRAPRLYIGSHLDTVADAGAFDGILGVVLAAALVDSRTRQPLPYSIEVVGFSDEEGVRFGVPFLGSHAMAGSFDAQWLERTDRAGVTLRKAIKQFGLDPARIPDARVRGECLGFLECHIEQGPVLEQLGRPLACVDIIAGQTRADIRFRGMAAHAGTTPMHMRRDALAGAAEWITDVERLAGSTAGLVATVGRIAAEPGSVNVVSGSTSVSLDVRHMSDPAREAAVEQILQAAADIAARRTLDVSHDVTLAQASVNLDARLARRLSMAMEAAGQTPHHMASGAGHDAMVMAGVMPAGMLFIRCTGGISHHPDEDVRAEDVAAAFEVISAFVDALAADPRAAAHGV